MSKMNELSIEDNMAAYEDYIESERQELRKEGAEELRKDILRELESYANRAWTSEIKQGLLTAAVIVEQASI